MRNITKIKCIALIFSGLFTSLLSQTAASQNEGRWYTVEVLIFKRLNASSLTDEFWPQDLSLNYPSQFQYLSEKTTDDLSLKENFRRLSRNVLRLNNHRESLRRNKNYEVLYHQAWQQQMQGKDDSPSIAIEGGKPVANSSSQSHSELEGFITFHIARFLHINTNLWLSEPSIARLQGADGVSTLPDRPLYGIQEAKDLEQALVNDRVPGQTLSERIGERLSRSTERLIQGASNDFDISQMGVADSYTNNNASSNTSNGVVALAQHRRMRSKELHYIDHPLMGMLIYINPISEGDQ